MDHGPVTAPNAFFFRRPRRPLGSDAPRSPEPETWDRRSTGGWPGDLGGATHRKPYLTMGKYTSTFSR